MRKLLFEGLIRAPLTERPPVAGEAALGERRFLDTGRCFGEW